MLVYPPTDAQPDVGHVSIGRRTAARLRVYIPGKLILLGSIYNCALEDISQTGARVMCVAAIGTGETGVLQCMKLDVLCKVVRADKNQFGLHFEEDVSAEDIQEMRRQNDIYRRNDAQEMRVFAKQWATGQHV